MKKLIIYSDFQLDCEEYREEYESSQREMFEDDEYVVSDDEFYSHLSSILSDERSNLDKIIDGVIIAFADIETWRGHFQGYKILGSNIASIFKLGADVNEWYGDGYNIRSTHTHHDGTNHVILRVAKTMKSAERIAQQIYNNEIDEKQFRKKTRSLYPHIAQIYGW